MLYEIGEVHSFACLVRMVFMKDFLLGARVVIRTSNMEFSRRRLADYVKTLKQRACRTCSTIVFLHSTNQVIDLWRCRWRCRCQILNSLLFCWVRDRNVRKCVPHVRHDFILICQVRYCFMVLPLFAAAPLILRTTGQAPIKGRHFLQTRNIFFS